MKVNDYKIKLQIWDTAGQEKFKSITKTFYKGSNGVFLIYDITNKSSFKSIKSWLSELRSNIENKVNIMLIGNKCDEDNDRKVSFKEGEEFAIKNDLDFAETSSLSNVNIANSFNKMAEKIIKEECFEQRNSLILGQGDTEKKNKKGCTSNC